ncbi:hypothetical protein [uncultured Desulfovibrio sp.]|uniref:hypothetical protein n=1 Tax=uncultured Desulfovibrio sp. TaxID=167968 RepID=UPI00265C9E11|nr:hypothetical protein [uncultured Desulfovibrio sp.]
MPFSRTPCSQCTCDSERDVPCGEQPKDNERRGQIVRAALVRASCRAFGPS